MSKDKLKSVPKSTKTPPGTVVKAPINIGQNIKAIIPPYGTMLRTLKGKLYNMADGSPATVQEVMIEALTEASPVSDKNINSAMFCYQLAKKVVAKEPVSTQEMAIISECVFARFKQPGLLGMYIDAVNTNSNYEYESAEGKSNSLASGSDADLKDSDAK